MGRPFNDLSGTKIGKLSIIKRAPDYIRPKDGRKEVMYECMCDCQLSVPENERKTIFVLATNLVRKSVKVKSCGCYSVENMRNIQKEYVEVNRDVNKKYNNYDLSGEYGIGWTSNTNEEFYFDLEDYDKIKDYCWMEHHGYIVTHINLNRKTKEINISRIITECDEDSIVDHIGHNKYDNRKCFLRVTDYFANNKNRTIQSNNSSGVVGVSWHSTKQCWFAHMGCNNHKLHLGYFDNFEDAVIARKEAEEKYFGEYSYDNSVKQYKELTNAI